MREKFPDDPIRKLIDIMSHLRSSDGCPWDRAQTVETLKPYLLEEAYEVIDALDASDPDEFRSELGDLLLQIVFMAQIQSESGTFDIDAVAQSICDKLIRRHPHVFGSAGRSDPESLDRQWDAIKSAEKKSPPASAADIQPDNLPALLLAQKLSGKMARVGFDWNRPEDVVGQLEDELNELKAALSVNDVNGVRDEIGDLLFTVVNLARHLDVDSESTLRKMIRRFQSRFRQMEELVETNGGRIDQLPVDQLNMFWQQAKGKLNEKT